MRVGVDSYSYHRLLGEIRPGEPPTDERLPNGGAAVIEEVARLGIDGVSLETCYLGRLDAPGARALVAAAGPLEVSFAWGAPNGLAFGQNRLAFQELLKWIEIAAAAGTRTMRIVVGGPALRGLAPVETQIARTVEPLRRAADRASALGITLAVENHGDLTARELRSLLDRVGAGELGVCFDTANALRVGGDVLEALELLAPVVHMVHMKDVEPVGATTDRLAGPASVRFGSGCIPLDDVVSILADHRFQGLVFVEIGQLGPRANERALVADGVRWLRRRLPESFPPSGAAA